MPADFLTAWLSTDAVPGEDEETTQKNAALLGSVMDAAVDLFVQQQMEDSEALYSAFVARVEVLGEGEPDPVDLLSDPGNITPELIESISDGSYTGVRGLVNETTGGPVLLRAICDVVVMGIDYAADTETVPGSTLLSLWWTTTYTPDTEERPQHLDDAVVFYLEALDWVT